MYRGSVGTYLSPQHKRLPAFLDTSLLVIISRMVRQKNRWLLVQLDFEDDIQPSCLSNSNAAARRDEERSEG